MAGVSSYSWAAIAAIITIATIMSAATRVVPGLGRAVLVDERARIGTLDGLRGLCALSVMFHHIIMIQLNQRFGLVGAPASSFQNQLGSGSVAIFFAISAYLFCGTVLRQDGRLPVVRFIENRVMRIVPLYLFCVVLTLLYALWKQSFLLTVSPSHLVRELVRLASFNFLKVYDLDGVGIEGIFGQRWSLAYEWELYAALPIFAWAVRSLRSPIPLFVGLAALSAVDSLFTFFVVGAAAARLERLQENASRRVLGCAGLGCILTLMFGVHESRSWLAAVLVLPFLLAVLHARGAYLMLALKPLRMLGEVSYSIYLLHPFCFRLFSWLVGRQIIASTFTDAYLLMSVEGLFVVAVAIGSFIIIERPTLRWRPVTYLRASLDKRRVTPVRT